MHTHIVPNYKISAKSGNPRLSYSDLKVENLVAVRHLGLNRKVNFKNQSLPLTHNASINKISAKSVLTTYGRVIDDGANFPVMFSGCNFVLCSSRELGGPNYTKFGEDIGHSLEFSKWFSGKLLHFETTKLQRQLVVNNGSQTLPCKNKGRSSSSSSSRNECYLGGIVALLLQDHRTVSLKTVCSSQHMVTEYDQH